MASTSFIPCPCGAHFIQILTMPSGEFLKVRKLLREMGDNLGSVPRLLNALNEYIMMLISPLTCRQMKEEAVDILTDVDMISGYGSMLLAGFVDYNLQSLVVAVGCAYSLAETFEALTMLLRAAVLADLTMPGGGADVFARTRKLAGILDPPASNKFRVIAEVIAFAKTLQLVDGPSFDAAAAAFQAEVEQTAEKGTPYVPSEADSDVGEWGDLFGNAVNVKKSAFLEVLW